LTKRHIVDKIKPGWLLKKIGGESVSHHMNRKGVGTK